MITNNKYIMQRMAMKALKLKWPDAKITDENFNMNFLVEFPNGELGYAGLSNGPLGCDLFKDQKHMESGQPYDSVEVCPVWDRFPTYYNPDAWEEEFPLDLYNECLGATITENHDPDHLGHIRGGYLLSVMVDRSDYVVAWALTIDELKEAATNYVWMLEAATDIDNLIDATDILLYPITNEYQLADSDFGWNEKRPFNELLNILYGEYNDTI